MKLRASILVTIIVLELVAVAILANVVIRVEGQIPGKTPLPTMFYINSPTPTSTPALLLPQLFQGYDWTPTPTPPP